MKYKLKNYSTTVSAEKTIAEIEKMLSQFGAKAIMKEYNEDGKVRMLSFKYFDKGFKLPANVNGVKKVLYEGKRSYHGRDSMKLREERAYRVTWRIIKDWVHAQLSLIASGQAHPHEIFLPYMYDGERTLYQALKERNFKLLEGKVKND